MCRKYALGSTYKNFDLSSLINKPTCYQYNNFFCNDLIMINKSNFLKLSGTFETGFSDHHKLISTILKSGGNMKSYRQFNSNHFNKALLLRLSQLTSKNQRNLS